MVTRDSAMNCRALVDCAYTGETGARVNGVRTYARVADALNDAPADSRAPYIIAIKNGRYYEKLAVAKRFVTLIGEDRAKTILTFDTGRSPMARRSGLLRARVCPFSPAMSASKI